MIGTAANANGTTHHFHQTPTDCQTQSGPAVGSGGGAVSLWKEFEKLWLVFFADANARILNFKFQEVVVPISTDNDFTMVGKLNGITHQV